MQRSFKKTLFALTVAMSTFASPVLLSAEIPQGTKLDATQHFRINNGSDPSSLDPHKIEGAPEGNIVRNIFETLVISDAQGNIIPGVAEKWEHSPDYKVWTFYLRPNAKWSNGEPLTADDFVYSFQRLADPLTASPYASYLDYLQLLNADDVISGKKPVTDLGIKALNQHTLQLTLSESIPYADKLMEHYVLAPVNKKAIEKYGDKWTNLNHIVTNGAFVPITWIINEKIELVPNPNYWDKDKVVLQKVTFYPISLSKPELDRYRSGDLDATETMPTEMFHRLKNQYLSEVFVPKALCTGLYEFNNQKPPFNNPKVRQAISMALDRNIITDKVLGQGQVASYNFTPNYISGGEKIKAPEWASWSQDKRNQVALQLLKEAGYDKNHPLTFSLLYNTSDDHKKVAVAFTSILRKNLQGVVNVKMINQEWKTYLDSRHQGNYELARAGWCADYNEATTFLTYFLSDSSNNTAFYKSKTFDDIIAQAYKAQDDEERAKFYAKAEEQLSQDAPLIPVYYYVKPKMIKPYVKGFAVNNPTLNYYLKDVYIIAH